MNKDLLIYMKNVGRAEEKLREIIDMDIMYALSKHDPIWDSELEREANQLEDARMALSSIYGRINDIIDLIDPEEFHEN